MKGLGCEVELGWNGCFVVTDIESKILRGKEACGLGFDLVFYV